MLNCLFCKSNIVKYPLYILWTVICNMNQPAWIKNVGFVAHFFLVDKQHVGKRAADVDATQFFIQRLGARALLSKRQDIREPDSVTQHTIFLPDLLVLHHRKTTQATLTCLHTWSFELSCRPEHPQLPLSFFFAVIEVTGVSSEISSSHKWSNLTHSNPVASKIITSQYLNPNLNQSLPSAHVLCSCESAGVSLTGCYIHPVNESKTEQSTSIQTREHETGFA